MSIFDGVATAVQGIKRQATIHTAINSGGAAQAASFSVDVEQIPALITAYKDAQDGLDQILFKAQQLEKIAPPGDDEVSNRLATALGDMAGRNEGCLSWAVDDAKKRLQVQIEQLEAAARDYQNVDEESRARQV